MGLCLFEAGEAFGGQNAPGDYRSPQPLLGGSKGFLLFSTPLEISVVELWLDLFFLLMLFFADLYSAFSNMVSGAICADRFDRNIR